MVSSFGKTHPVLASAGRLPRATSDSSFAATDLLILALAGVGAACCEAWLHTNLRVPGHAILRAVAPMMVGLAMVPRYGAGTIMTFFAGLTWPILNIVSPEGISNAAGLSMLFVGPSLDLTLAGAPTNRQLYPRCALAGVTANLAALALKVGGQLTGIAPMNRSLSHFLPMAVPGFILCGALAGLLLGVAMFRGGDDGTRGADAS